MLTLLQLETLFFANSARNNVEVYYDRDFDKDVIAASIAAEYGIMKSEQGELRARDYANFLVGLSPERPLSRLIQIRSETDAKRIKNMTKAELRVRSEWEAFKIRKHQASMSKQEIETERKERKQRELKMLEKIFG